MKPTIALATKQMEETIQCQLQKKIAALDAITGDLPWVAIVHCLQTLDVVYMSPNGQQILGFSLDELKKMGNEYHARFFNPEAQAYYAPKVQELLNSSDDDKFVTIFQQVRPSPAHNWSWYLTTAKVFLRNSEGKPVYMISLAAPIDPLHHVASKANRLLEENNFLRRYQKVFASLTNREKEVLRLMALGETSEDIAAKLFISDKTAQTHRRNIKAKLNAQSNYDITQFAQAFDLI